ncbi:MAG: chromate efflux transporter [Candidatus Binataceae bacterium]
MAETSANTTAGTVRGDLRTELKQLAALFLRLGFTAFGGPAAHIAMMEDEVVRRRGWLSSATFLDMLGATNLIPGPNSTEMAIHIGHRRAGFIGLVVAGACFIVPAVAMTIVIAWAYVKFGKLPQVGGVLYGVKPVIIAVVLQALWRLGRSAVKSRLIAAVAIIATAAGLLGVNDIAVLFGAGLLMVAVHPIFERPRTGVTLAGAASVSAATSTAGSSAIGKAGARTMGAAPIAKATAAIVATPFALSTLFLFFLKVGSILFGSGYVLLAFLESDLVDRLRWLTQGQLLDAVAVGQMTPGPVFCTATFVGYILGGLAGAAVATIGIFLPAFFFVAVSGPILPYLRRLPITAVFLDGVNAGALALMAVVEWQLSRAALVDVTTIVLALVSAVLLLRLRLNSVWLVLLGGAAGAAAGWIGG